MVRSGEGTRPQVESARELALCHRRRDLHLPIDFGLRLRRREARVVPGHPRPRTALGNLRSPQQPHTPGLPVRQREPERRGVRGERRDAVSKDSPVALRQAREGLGAGRGQVPPRRRALRRRFPRLGNARPARTPRRQAPAAEPPRRLPAPHCLLRRLQGRADARRLLRLAGLRAPRQRRQRRGLLPLIRQPRDPSRARRQMNTSSWDRARGKTGDYSGSAAPRRFPAQAERPVRTLTL
mmetsp:Transcript_15567/g.48691  ORF Transcript_15567/g.48691 Transcript_15567/m.48691 type:complete len:239 (-) Transcript_15567:71-787(-)